MGTHAVWFHATYCATFIGKLTKLDHMRVSPVPKRCGREARPSAFAQRSHDGARLAAWPEAGRTRLHPSQLAVIPRRAPRGTTCTSGTVATRLTRVTMRFWLKTKYRLFKGPDTNVNLHVFTAGCKEVATMIRFRDHLRTNEADRKLYAREKRELAAREWKYGQQYATRRRP